MVLPSPLVPSNRKFKVDAAELGDVLAEVVAKYEVTTPPRPLLAPLLVLLLALLVVVVAVLLLLLALYLRP